MSDVTTIAPRRSAVLADLLPGTLLRDLLLVAGGAAFVGLVAQISFHLSFTPVPVTGQTLGVVVSGTALGSRRGGASMALYAVAGVAGVPWFAGHSAGYGGASFGYIVGFVLCAALCGWLAERGASRSVRTSVPAMVAGEVVLFATGVTWLAFDLHVSAGEAIALGFTPFVVGEVVKTAIAALLLPAAWKVAGTRR